MDNHFHTNRDTNHAHIDIFMCLTECLVEKERRRDISEFWKGFSESSESWS